LSVVKRTILLFCNVVLSFYFFPSNFLKCSLVFWLKSNSMRKSPKLYPIALSDVLQLCFT